MFDDEYKFLMAVMLCLGTVMFTLYSWTAAAAMGLP